MKVEKINGFAGMDEDDDVSVPWDFIHTIIMASKKIGWCFDIITSQRIQDECKRHYMGEKTNEYDLIMRHPSVNNWKIDDSINYMIFRPSYPFGMTVTDMKLVEKGIIKEIHTGNVESSIWMDRK